MSDLRWLWRDLKAISDLRRDLTFLCPVCEGKGEYIEFSEPEIGTLWYPCYQCDKSGRISLWSYLQEMFWKHICPLRLMEWYSEWRYTDD